MALGFQWPAVRATSRLARRDAWRNKGRSALIALMVALPVLAGSTVSVLYRSSDQDPQDAVRLALGTQGQATLAIGDGNPILQSVYGRDRGSIDGTAAGSDNQPKPISYQQFRDRAATMIPPRDRVVTDTAWFSSRPLRFHDRALQAQIREIDYANAGLPGLIEPVSGHAPTTLGEVVVTQRLAKDKGIKAGDSLSLVPAPGEPAKPLTVVGVVGGITLIGNSAVIGLPGSLIPAELNHPTGYGSTVSQNLLVSGPDPVTWDQVLNLNQIGSMVLSRSVVEHPPSSDRVPYDQQDYMGTSSVNGSDVGIAVVIIGLVLLQIALLAGPAIAVGARRNQRTLALMASTGAERKHLRAVVLATSGVIGLVSCAAAALLGAGLGAILVPLLRRYFDYQLVRTDIHPLDLLGLALVGALTSVAAALIPARQAAKLDVVAALTGRRGQQPPRLRVPVIGLLVALAGAVLAYIGSQSIQPFVTVAGLALAEIGLVAASGAIVALAARFAVRLPFVPRFALRDAARQRGRTAPAVAAVLAAIAGGTAALVYIAAQANHDQQSYTPSSARGVVTLNASPELPGNDYTELQAALRRTLPLDRVATLYGPANRDDGVGAVFLMPITPPANECPIHDGDYAPDPAKVRKLSKTDPRCAPMPSGPSAFTAQGATMFDDGSALRVLTGVSDPANTAALQAGQVLVSDRLLLWPDGTVHIDVSHESADDQNPPKDDTVILPARLISGPSKLQQPVYPRVAADRLGIKIAQVGLLATTTRMPTPAEQDKASAAISNIDESYLTVERGYQGEQYALVLLALVAAAALVTLGGTFTAVGLAASEGRADVATLAAVGASPGMRRRLAAAQAGVIAGLGAVLGVTSGVLAGWILVRMQQDDLQGANFGSIVLGDRWSLAIPWVYLLATGFGVPLLAVLVGYLSTRSRLPLIRRLGQ